MELFRKLLFLCILSACVTVLCRALEKSKTISKSKDVKSDLGSEKVSDDTNIVSDTSDEDKDTGDKGKEDDLVPEDEDMIVFKLDQLGGILDSEDIKEIEEEEQTLEDLEGQEDIPEEENLRFEPIPMPTDFVSYDRNGDGKIVMEELIEVTGAFENVADAFSVSDKNGDGYIDSEEFKDAPWDLAGKPPEVALEQL